MRKKDKAVKVDSIYVTKLKDWLYPLLWGLEGVFKQTKNKSRNQQQSRGMKRHKLTEEQWNKVKELLPPEKPAHGGRPGKDNRVMLNGSRIS